MKVQYVSDLHLEFRENRHFLNKATFPVEGDVLVIAGDTFYLNDTTLSQNKFLKWASDNYKQVLLITGNHEYYNFCDVMARGMRWKWMLAKNVGYYQNQVVRVDDTDFVLSTLWSYVPPQDEYSVSHGLNDFRMIMYKGKRMTVENYNEMHRYCVSFIRKSIEESTAKHIVVVTHHLPTMSVVAPQHQGSPLNSGFATELGNMIANSGIDAWIYGHSHTNIDTKIGDTRIVSNQMGYVFNGFSFRKNLII